MLALIVIGALHFALPKSMSVGPRWIVPATVAMLVLLTVGARHRGRHTLNQTLGVLVNAVVTADMVWLLSLLISALSSRRETARELIISATIIWVANVLVFASWYWRLDAGGPRSRELRRFHLPGAFLFPQAAMSSSESGRGEKQDWSPTFLDYLFIALNSSTAFSPTDAPVLSRWAKVLMMLQALVSLATVVLLAARAVNLM